MYPYDPTRHGGSWPRPVMRQGLELTITLPQPYDFHIRNGEIIAQQLNGWAFAPPGSDGMGQLVGPGVFGRDTRRPPSVIQAGSIPIRS